jgi:hypothetical protein
MNMRQIFVRLVGGIRGVAPTMNASVPGPGIPGDLVDLARISHSATQGDIVFEPTRPLHRGPQTIDLNPETGKKYDDYIERPLARDAAEAAKRAEPVLAGVVKHDVYPRD